MKVCPHRPEEDVRYGPSMRLLKLVQQNSRRGALAQGAGELTLAHYADGRTDEVADGAFALVLHNKTRCADSSEPHATRYDDVR